MRTFKPNHRSSRAPTRRAPVRRDGQPGNRGRERALGRIGAERGDTLIEVLIGSVLLALIVVGTLSGLDSTNRATALQRSRSQADALAEQDQEQLRSAPIKKLYELESHPESKNVTVGKTVYTIATTAKYIDDTTGTTSCASSAAKAQYLQTTSTVTWPSRGVSKPVVESSVISPPPGSALIVQVSESGTPLQGATVTATGPAPETTAHTLETSESGCAILAVAPGEYKINASDTGYVDPNGYANTEEDPSTTHSVYIVAETTVKQGYFLGRPGTLAVSFSGGESGDTFVAFNTGMANFKSFGTLSSYNTTVNSSKTLYPFGTKYTVYAGTCEADKPATIKSENEVLVPPGGTGSATLALPPLKLKVYSGTSGKPGPVVNGASGSVVDEGCSTKRNFSTVGGAMPHPGLPYGKYTLCVTASVGSPAKQRRYTKKEITLASASGLEEAIYLESEPESVLTTC